MTKLDDNGAINKGIILEQWKTCVEMANSVSQRRDTMNNIFVTVNLAIIAAVTVSWDLKCILLSVAGIVICIIWFLFIGNYKNLNKEKFQIIHKLEKKLPAQPFTDEWFLLKANKKYMNGTKLEKVLPSAFIAMHGIIIGIIATQQFF